MKILLTKKTPIKAKTGITYVKLDYVSLIDGSTGSIMPNETEYLEKYTSLPILDEKDLGDLTKTYQSSEIEFDQRGRMVTLK